jgi:hypothetical protein
MAKRRQTRKRKSSRKMRGGALDEQALLNLGFTAEQIAALQGYGIENMDLITMSLQQNNPQSNSPFTPQELMNSLNEVQNEINNRLSIEQSNDALVNQLNTLTKTVDDFALQIQNSLQKSVEEGILRASLQSQNTGFKAQIQALIKQIDSLNSIIEGLQSQLGAVQNQQAIVQGTQAQAQAAGADVVNEVAIVKLEPEEDTNQPKIWARFKSGGGSQWKNGKSLTITNNDKKEITVKLTKFFY